ncbi:hypothetical protein BP6252_02416 [Coleophoma cylindrospora]|uniref:NmrA-like domain-containing protein n=1 Tax=Coleophoma cylindrospora TaxID=1849047 RepID=A0A3D8SEW0_9HELO|nr:hypothetical protein BP6252_02416 [Coleophoma cylindrospora]
MAKLFTVFGATGQQGGALIKYLLAHPQFSTEYTIRGITRDAQKPAAIALKEQGVEIVEADLDEPSSLSGALAGSYAVFAVTNYWEKASASVEIAQGKAMADAAVSAGASLLIWSSLPRTGVGHFDSKATVEDHIRTLPIKSLYYMPGWFMQNFLVIMKPRKKKEEGPFIMSRPWPNATVDSLVPLVDIEDTGKYLEPFLLDPDKYNQVVFMASTAFYTPREICQTWSRVTGKTVEFDGTADWASNEHMSPEQKKKLTDSNVSSGSNYYGPRGKEGLEWTLAQVGNELTTWDTFVERNEPWFPEALK